MTVRKRHLKIALAISCLLPASIIGTTARADTEDELEAAEAKVAQLRSEASAATARYDEIRGRLISTQDAIEATQASLARARKRIGGLQSQLADRAREVYQLGGTSTVELLLSADSLSEFSDRMVYLDRLADADADLVGRVAVLSEQLRRRQEDLAELEAQLAKDTAEAERQKEIVYGNLAEAQALEEKLQDKLEAEQAAAAAAARAARAAVAPVGGSGSIAANGAGALQACPAPGTTFTDTFGAPRSGGRTHQGVDMMGPYGTPVYAAQSGSVSHSSSSLGGNQAYVYAGNGDYTFYAHLQGYSDASGNVSAGTLIGYIGDTGNATGTPHLHFEYHPGGGAAVNPTPYVAAVC
ncbi:MAG: murein hydrolase activator EnvC family protein [Actinomycetota bacterium]